MELAWVRSLAEHLAQKKFLELEYMMDDPTENETVTLLG